MTTTTATKTTTTTTTTTTALERARGEIAAENHEQGLTALLQAWRLKRAPRIADAIDLVSHVITQSPSRPKIDAKMVRDRSAKWIAIAKEKDPADLGRLYATPWPKKWKDAKPLFEIVEAFPDDPRTATALADVGSDSSSFRFYGHIFQQLARLLDIRALPRCRAFTFIEIAEQEPLQALITELEAHAALVRLTSEEETALAAIEACFAKTIATSKSNAKSEEELLAEVYADPDSDAPREVLADFLTERNEPRGEFISLQLARHAGRAAESRTRETELLKKHGKGWAGPLEKVITNRKERVYERGFLAIGFLNLPTDPSEVAGQTDEEIARQFQSPALSTMTALIGPFQDFLSPLATAAILAHPTMRFVRALRGFSVPVITALAKLEQTKQLRLEEIVLVFNESDAWDSKTIPPDVRANLAALAASAETSFPKLTHLGVQLTFNYDNLWLLVGGGFGKQLEAITIYTVSLKPGPIIQHLEKNKQLAPSLKELHFRPRNTYTFDEEQEWHLVFRRDAKSGRFTRLHAEPCGRGPRKLPRIDELADAIKSLATPDGLTELTIRKASTPCTNDEVIMIERCLEAFTAPLTHTDLPWGRVDLNAPVVPTKPAKPALAPHVRAEGPPIHLVLEGKELSKTHVTELFALASEPPIGLGFDMYEVNRKGFADLPPKEKAIAALVKKTVLLQRTERLIVSRQGMEQYDRGSITFAGDKVSITTEPHEVADDVVGWLRRMLAAAPSIERGEVSFTRPQPNDQRAYAPLERPLRWMWIFGEATSERIPFDEVVALSKTNDLGWLRIERAAKHLIVVFSSSPREIPDDARVSAFEIALTALMWRTWAKKHGGGSTPAEIARALLTEPLAKAGFTYVEEKEAKRANSDVRFVSSSGRLYELTASMWQERPSFSFNQRDGERAKAMFGANEENLRTKLEAIRTRLDVAWFDMFKAKKS